MDRLDLKLDIETYSGQINILIVLNVFSKAEMVGLSIDKINNALGFMHLRKLLTFFQFLIIKLISIIDIFMKQIRGKTEIWPVNTLTKLDFRAI
jgi:hypothetical protein